MKGIYFTKGRIMIASFLRLWNSPESTPAVFSEDLQASPRLKSEQTVLVTQIFKGLPDSNCISMECSRNVPNQAGTGFAASNFFRFSPETTFLEVFENTVALNTVSFYGIPQWIGNYWFSSLQENVPGFLSVSESDPKKSNFYPFNAMSSDYIPILISSCSKTGANGYACVVEDNIVEFAVSLWDMNSTSPKQLFREADFCSLRFMDGRFLFGLNFKNQFVCWDLQERKLRFSIDRWIRKTEFYPYFGPNFSDKNIQFVSNGRYMYAFNTIEMKLKYILELRGESGVGIFSMTPVGSEYISFREVSDPNVFVYDAFSGAQVSSFKIGGGVDYIDTDDFPACIYKGFIGALASDRKTVCLVDPANGKVTKTFGPTDDYVTGLYCTEGRILASCMCTTEIVPTGYIDQVYIWDIATGKLLEIIKPPEGYGLSPQDITDDLLTIYLYPNSNRRMRNRDRNSREKSFVKEKFEPERSQKRLNKKDQEFQWTDPDPIMLDNNEARFLMVNTKSGKVKMEFKEEFKPSDDVTFAAYRSGILMVDANSVIRQSVIEPAASRKISVISPGDNRAWDMIKALLKCNFCSLCLNDGYEEIVEAEIK